MVDQLEVHYVQMLIGLELKQLSFPKISPFVVMYELESTNVHGALTNA